MIQLCIRCKCGLLLDLFLFVLSVSQIRSFQKRVVGLHYWYLPAMSDVTHIMSEPCVCDFGEKQGKGWIRQPYYKNIRYYKCENRIRQQKSLPNTPQIMLCFVYLKAWVMDIYAVMTILKKCHISNLRQHIHNVLRMQEAYLPCRDDLEVITFGF